MPFLVDLLAAKFGVAVAPFRDHELGDISSIEADPTQKKK